MHCFCLTLFPQRAQPDLLLLVVLCVVIAMRNPSDHVDHVHVEHDTEIFKDSAY